MNTLAKEFNQLCNGNRDGSHSTQKNRKRILSQIATDLNRMGFRNLTIKGLKQKHIVALVGDWQKRSLTEGTMKNRMSPLRWVTEKCNRPSLIAKTNDNYGIAKREYQTNVNKGRQLDANRLEQIRDPSLRLSLRLQAAFGLRREEALKFSPSYADKDDHILLKASWCKGGRAREIPIRNEEQRAVLDEAHKLAGRGSMIPPQRSYVQQLRLYENRTAAAGMSKNHGLRHQFAQDVYRELTGRDAPCVGGPSRHELTKDQLSKEEHIRLQISEMLGHSRAEITAIYLGS